jgi:hypothetical protein
MNESKGLGCRLQNRVDGGLIPGMCSVFFIYRVKTCFQTHLGIYPVSIVVYTPWELRQHFEADQSETI